MVAFQYFLTTQRAHQPCADTLQTPLISDTRNASCSHCQQCLGEWYHRMELKFSLETRIGEISRTRLLLAQLSYLLIASMSNVMLFMIVNIKYSLEIIKAPSLKSPCIPQLVHKRSGVSTAREPSRITVLSTQQVSINERSRWMHILSQFCWKKKVYTSVMILKCEHLQTEIMYLVREVAHAALKLYFVCMRRDCKPIYLSKTDWWLAPATMSPFADRFFSA